MSAMAKMITDMLLKELPAEIRDALTPENMEKVAQGLASKWLFIEGSLNSILMEQREQRAILEELLKRDNGSSEFGDAATGAGSPPLAIASARTGTDG